MLYLFDDVKQELGLNDDRMRYHIRKNKLQYVKMGHKRSSQKNNVIISITACFK